MTNLSNRSLVILIIVSIIVVIVSILYKKNDRVTTVFNEFDYNKTYVVDLEGYGITTENIGDYFDNDIIAIYPSIGKKYLNIISGGWYYIDKTISMDKNIDYLNRYYKRLFDNNNLNREALEIELNGIIIGKAKVVTDNINKYSNYNIEKVNFE